MASKDNKQKGFMQMSPLPFAENVNRKDKGSMNNAALSLPFAENVNKKDSILSARVTLPFAENVPKKETEQPKALVLPFAENIGAQKKEEEIRKDIQFITNTAESTPAGMDISQPVWKKVEWGGLNLRNTIDSGELSYAKNLSTDEYPYLTPRQSRNIFRNSVSGPQALFAIENAIMWIGTNSGNDVLYYTTDNVTINTYILVTHTVDKPRSMVDYGGKVLIFPDKKYLDYTSLPASGSTLPSIGTGTYPADGSCPDIDYATVNGDIARIFAVQGDTMYVNEYDMFDKWTTFEGIESDSFAIEVTSQGDFKGIGMYKGHAVMFKPNYTHEQWLTRPPFKVQGLFNVGTIDNRSIKEVNGRLFFCSKDGVYIYTGGEQKLISLKLNKQYVEARAGSDGRKYYLSMNDGTTWDLFVYDTWFDLWTREDDLQVVEFAYWKGNMYAITNSSTGIGAVWKFNEEGLDFDWEAITEYYAGDIIGKYVHEIRTRFEIANYTALRIYVQYDDGDFEQIPGMTYTVINTIYSSGTNSTAIDFDKNISEYATTEWESSGIVLNGNTYPIVAIAANSVVVTGNAASDANAQNIINDVDPTYLGTSSTSMKSLVNSIIPKEAYRYRIKFAGTGYAKIHAMEVLMSIGGD